MTIVIATLTGKKYASLLTNEDTLWLGGKDGGQRAESKKGEWPVSYHGFAKDIAAAGYSLEKGWRFKYGRGAFTVPQILLLQINMSG